MTPAEFAVLYGVAMVAAFFVGAAIRGWLNEQYGEQADAEVRK